VVAVSLRVRNEALGEDELARSLAMTESAFVSRLQSVGGFGGKSDQLNSYNVFLGNPGYFSQDLERYRRAGGETIRAAARAWLEDRWCATLSVVPKDAGRLAAPDSEPVVIT